MRSIEDTLTVMLMAVDKRYRNSQAQLEKSSLTQQSQSAVKGQIQVSEAVLGNLVDLQAAIKAKPERAEQYVQGTLLQWRREAMAALQTAFSAHLKSDARPFANRFYTAQATLYAVVVDELSYALATREQYASLAEVAEGAPTGGSLAC